MTDEGLFGVEAQLYFADIFEERLSGIKYLATGKLSITAHLPFSSFVSIGRSTAISESRVAKFSE